MAMRIEIRIAEPGRDPVLQTLRNVVFKPLRLVMHLVPREIQNVMQESLDQPVMSLDLERPPFACLRQPNAVVLFVSDERWLLTGKLL